MTQQFQHYTDGISLYPFGGHPSIPFKWQIAKTIERCHRRYQKPVKILYFGDLDEAGEIIYRKAVQDVQSWCNVQFDFIRCGLNDDQVEKYDVPENFEHPGYQWEALTDEGAGEIITEGVSQFISDDVIEDTRQQEEEIGQDVIEKIMEAVNDIEF